MTLFPFLRYIDGNDNVTVANMSCEIGAIGIKVKEYFSKPELAFSPRCFKDSVIDLIGLYTINNTVISIKCERNTSYDAFIQVQNQIEKAFDEMWNIKALFHFGKKYIHLSYKEKKAIRSIVPKIISEAEPTYVRNEKGELVKNEIDYWFY